MSESLAELIAVARAAPKNVDALRDLANAASRRNIDPTPALDYIEELKPHWFDKVTRLNVARLMLYRQRAKAALAWWTGWPF